MVARRCQQRALQQLCRTAWPGSLAPLADNASGRSEPYCSGKAAVRLAAATPRPQVLSMVVAGVARVAGVADVAGVASVAGVVAVGVVLLAVCVVDAIGVVGVFRVLGLVFVLVLEWLLVD